MIGKKVKSLREKKGLTRKEVAEHLCISQSAYARMERGEGNSWALHLDKLSNIFEVSLIELLNELISTDGLISNPKIKGDYTQNYNGYVINQLSEKLIDQYEARIAEKDTVIKELRGQVNEFKKERK